MKKLLTFALVSLMTVGAYAHCGDCAAKGEGHAKECKACDKSKDKKKDKECKACDKKAAASEKAEDAKSKGKAKGKK